MPPRCRRFDEERFASADAALSIRLLHGKPGPAWPPPARKASAAGWRSGAAALLVALSAAFWACTPEVVNWTETKGPEPRVQAPPDAPDILVVVVDALRADHLSAYGYARSTSPFLDRWSAGAMRLESAWTQATHTRISIASFFSGSRPTVHRVRNVDLPNDDDDRPGLVTDALAGSLTTLAESLHATGYETWALSANPHLCPELGFNQGFSRWWQTSERRGGATVAKLAAELARRRSGLARPPLFVYLHLMSVHNPYSPPPPFDTAFPAPAGKVVFRNGPATVAPEDLAHTIARYDGGIRYTDSLLEAVIQAWESTPGRPKAVLVLSDHGEEFGEHGGLGHGMTVYRENARIPAFLKGPGIPAGKFHHPVTTLDLARLVLDLGGAPAPSHARGRPLDHWAHPDSHDPVVYTESRNGWVAYREGDHVLVFPVDRPEESAYYDAGSDPVETVPLQEAAVLAALTERLGRALSEDGPLAESLGTPERRVLGEDAAEELRGLGYLGGH